MSIIILIPTTPERRERLARCIESVRENSNHPHVIMTFENTIGWVGAVREMLSKLNPYSLAVIINDDCVPQKDWLKILYASHLMHPDHLLQPNDGIMQGKVATMPFATVGYLLENIYDGYKSYYADTELTDRAIRQNRYGYVPEAIVTHEHWSNGQASKDQTYHSQEVNLEHDRALYESRRNG